MTQPVRIDLGDAAWETWDDEALVARSAVRWKLAFTAERTPTGAMSMGLAEIAPGGLLPLHRHAPAEIYHVLDGDGSIEIDDVPMQLGPGVSVFIPANAWHRTVNTGLRPLRFLFVFPTDSFAEIVYVFAADGVPSARG